MPLGFKRRFYSAEIQIRPGHCESNGPWRSEAFDLEIVKRDPTLIRRGRDCPGCCNESSDDSWRSFEVKFLIWRL